MPDVPTDIESGFPDRVADNDYLLFAPARTPRTVLDTLGPAVSTVLKQPDVMAKMAANGAETSTARPTSSRAL